MQQSTVTTILGALTLTLASACTGGSGESDGTETEGASASGTDTETAQLPNGCDALFVGGRDDREAIATALIEAEDDTTLCFEGVFEFTTDRLSASEKRGLTLRGVGEGEGVGAGARFDFMDTVGPVGVEFQNMTDITIEGITIANAAGDGLEVRGSENVIFRDVKVTWDRQQSTKNGAYGFYPVESVNVLMEHCEASYASDAGVYVGQSDNIIVRHNVAFGNVSGIQLENSEQHEVHDNEVYDNAVGMLIHDLPGLPKVHGGRTWVHDNVSRDNNGENFADSGIFAANLPPGVGILFLAIDEVEASDNTITGNGTAGVLIASYNTVALLTADTPHGDPGYDPYPEDYFIHDNAITGNGTDAAEMFKEIGLDALADIVWDGDIDDTKDNADGELDICFKGNDGATFNQLQIVDLPNPLTDITPYICEHDPIGATDNGLG